jgi:hypothetical protein
MATVMATEEETEGGAAGRRVAARRSRVRLPVIPSWEASNLAEVLILHPLVLSQLADTAAVDGFQSGATGDGLVGLSVIQAV